MTSPSAYTIKNELISLFAILDSWFDRYDLDRDNHDEMIRLKLALFQCILNSDELIGQFDHQDKAYYSPTKQRKSVNSLQLSKAKELRYVVREQLHDLLWMLEWLEVSQTNVSFYVNAFATYLHKQCETVRQLEPELVASI